MSCPLQPFGVRPSAFSSRRPDSVLHAPRLRRLERVQAELIPNAMEHRPRILFDSLGWVNVNNTARLVRRRQSFAVEDRSRLVRPVERLQPRMQRLKSPGGTSRKRNRSPNRL